MDVSTLADFHFLHPLWLLALPPLWLLAAWFSRRRNRDGGWSQVIDAELLPALRMQAGGSGGSIWWLLTLIWTIAVLALAGPTWQRERSPVFRAPADWIVVLDLSPSMGTADLQPDRATRARYAIADILNTARDARVALVVFADDAHTVAPLTTDVATVRALLPPLAPDIMPEAGDALAPALQEVSRLIDASGSRRPQVIVFSDGFVDPADALRAAQALRQQGATLNVVGMGTSAGAPETNREGGFVKDAQGQSVISRLPVDRLQRVAAAGGGSYRSVAEVNQLIVSLQAAHSNQMEQDREELQLELDTWRNAGIWLLPPLLLLVPLLARRGWL